MATKNEKTIELAARMIASMSLTHNATADLMEHLKTYDREGEETPVVDRVYRALHALAHTHNGVRMQAVEIMGELHGELCPHCNPKKEKSSEPSEPPPRVFGDRPVRVVEGEGFTMTGEAPEGEEGERVHLRVVSPGEYLA